MPAIRLNYLFRCDFQDGSRVWQTPEDVSSTGRGSAFTDVAARLSEVSRFWLTNGRKTVTVDLSDGHFEIDGWQFFIETLDDGEVPELVYFRRRTEILSANGAQSSECEFHVGWKCGTKRAEIAFPND